MFCSIDYLFLLPVKCLELSFLSFVIPSHRIMEEFGFKKISQEIWFQLLT